MKTKLLGLVTTLIIGLFLSTTIASATTIHFSGAFSSATGNLFSVGETFSGTVDYDPATANFVSGDSSVALYTISTSIHVLVGGTAYTFPVFELIVTDQLFVQFIATNFNTFFLIFGQTQNALSLSPVSDLVPGFRPAVFHIWLSDASQATGSVDVLDATPLPVALPLFATGLGALGLLGWRRKRKISPA